MLFFSGLNDLWPLAKADLYRDKDSLRDEAFALLASRGFSVDGWEFSTNLQVNDSLLDYLEHSFGREDAQQRIISGFPIYRYCVTFKKPGEPRAYSTVFDPMGRPQQWNSSFEDDDAGDSLDVETARELAFSAIAESLKLDTAGFVEKTASTRALDRRLDHFFTWERIISTEPELREAIHAQVAGSKIAHLSRTAVIPPSELRSVRTRNAPADALGTVGYAFIAIGTVAAFLILLFRLNSRDILLPRILGVTAVIFACLIGADLLRPESYFQSWDTLTPKLISYARTATFRVAGYLQLMILLLAFIGAGDALDRTAGSGRGDSLWALCTGRILDRRVADASSRGFLIGLCCGGVLVIAVSAITRFAGGSVSIQPRGFFFYGINSISPSFSLLLFFLFVALTEELGYRFFGGALLMKITGNRIASILIPAAIYGLAHTPFDFLPPTEPFWGRALALTLVSCVWGWAFFRFDALTVILSHYTADLFIFNWPRLGSGKFELIAAAIATIAVPLIPAVVRYAMVFFKRSNEPTT